MVIISSNLKPIFKILAGKFSNKFAVKWFLWVPPYLAYVATLPGETIMPENKRLMINYKVV